jgi:DNA modification methylase
VIGGAPDATAAETETVEEPDPVAPTVARTGDLWILGPHRIFCGNALEANSYDVVLDGDCARMVFADPPFNVPVNGHVRSGNAGQHREFAMASGEMTDGEFRAFLKAFVAHAMTALPDGGIAMVCMDWRHVEELIAAGKGCGLELINLCVWNKTNGGMGSLYRSKHELVCVFRKPGAPHINNVELGRHGRNRTNVWDYAGVNSFGKGRAADLVDHPTVKPIALVADAIMDVTHRGDVVLDCFGGSGSTLLAAEKTGRKARLIELDPAYVDVAIRRWQEMTGKDAIHAASGQAFEERAKAELAETESEEAGDVDA